jgi:hypothetical protein
LSGANYVITYLTRNPYFQKRIYEFFPNGNIAQTLLKILFRPLNEIIEEKNRFVSSHLNNSFFVSFHFRTEYEISLSEWKAYRECAIATVPHHLKGKEQWFVSTDSMESRQLVQDNLSEEILFYSPNEFVRGAFKKGLQQALIDILIAADADIIFTTPHSSFSNKIGFFAKTSQVFVVSDWNVPEADPHRNLTEILPLCYRFRSKEPCVWHGYQRTIHSIISKTSCFTPNMIGYFC